MRFCACYRWLFCPFWALLILFLALHQGVCDAPAVQLPDDPAFWQRLDALPPTPEGEGWVPGLASGESLCFRFPVPSPRPAAYRVNLDTIVALRGGGTHYRLDVHLDAIDGPIVYRGAAFDSGEAFNADDLSCLDLSAWVAGPHVAAGALDLWVTVEVEGDLWTSYRDDDGSRWDLYAMVPSPDGFAAWKRAREAQAEWQRRGLYVVPQPQVVEAQQGTFQAGETLSVALFGSTDPADQRSAYDLCAEMSLRRGRDVPLVDELRDRQVRLVRVTSTAELSAAVGFPLAAEPGSQGYALAVTPEGIVGAATTAVGLYYASMTLSQLVRTKGQAIIIEAVHIVDWPDLQHRMVQYDIARGNTVDVTYWKRWIRELSRLKINEIMLYMEDDWHSPRFPFLGRPGTLTPAKAAELVAYAGDYHVTLVPQVESLGHADALLQHDELADLRLGGGTGAFCPQATGTLAFLDELYAELASAFPQTDLVHIGGDEVWGFAADPRCAEMVAAQGEEGVYAFHLSNLAHVLKKRQRTMAFWGDEILNHPRTAEALSRESVVFDWHYGDQRDYPSIAFFQERGFERIYVCPAVHGFFDVYPQYRQAFGNIRGFIGAGVQRQVEGACCTTWGMNRGGNAENYLYGLAYAAECSWSSRQCERGFFDRRFAAAWLGFEAGDASEDLINHAFWFAWQKHEGSPFWQQLFRVSEFFFGDVRTAYAELTEAQRTQLGGECRVLLDLCDRGKTAVAALRRGSTRNLETLVALEHAIDIHRHVARTGLVMSTFARSYRTAYLAGDMQSPVFLDSAAALCAGLTALQDALPSLQAGIRRGVDERCGDPNDLRLFTSARDALADYAAEMGNVLAAMQQGDPPPPPDRLGLGPRFRLPIGQWDGAQVNPSDREHARQLVFDVTRHNLVPGIYDVVWDYQSGEDGLDVLRTALMAPDGTANSTETERWTVLCEDRHPAFTGIVDRANAYRVEVPPHQAERALFVVGTVYNQRDFGTRGVVWLEQSWE